LLEQIKLLIGKSNNVIDAGKIESDDDGVKKRLSSTTSGISVATQTSDTTQKTDTTQITDNSQIIDNSQNEV